MKPNQQDNRRRLSVYVMAILMAIMSINSYGQSRTISGKITDAGTNEDIIGATVLIKGTTRGATTDVTGRFSLEAANGDVLEISFVGYETTSLVVSSNTNFDITLFPSIESLMEVVVVGSRNENRTVTDSPVPIDVIDISQLANSNGKIEINQILQYAAPSFNATKQSGSDGADHIDPASLRGLGPDQTLVLINGKRRHQSSLINVFGTRGRGNTGTDMNAIPASAIKRIEILRDGASAQYGSDAIAGVINIVLKDNTDGVTAGVTYGAYSTNVGDGWEDATGETLWNVNGQNRLDGEDKNLDGNTRKVDINYGLPIGTKGGFANITTEFINKDRTLRPGFGWRKGYGSAELEGYNFMVNAAAPITSSTDFYAFGGRNFRHTDAYAFSRDSFTDGDNRSVPSLYPNGFTPHITSNITDASITTGIKHDLDNGWKLDFSNSYGKNNFHYYIEGTNNASLGAASATDFDAGGHSLAMNVTNLDFTRFYPNIMSGFNMAFGTEFRTERFEIFSGEEASYAQYDGNGDPIIMDGQFPAQDINGDDLPGGAQGFPGYSPDNVVDRSRTNMGLYVDSELNFTDAWLVSGAVRYERYSDFGETSNVKLASRYNVAKFLTVRGSVSSGFRAPSLAQIHYNLIFNNIVGGVSLPSLLSANTSTVTRAFGIGPLKQETAFNKSIGFTLTLGDFTATVDAYSISVKDRIVLTDNFDASGFGLGVDAAQFFANGVDTKTEGIDFVLNYKRKLAVNRILNFGVIGNFNWLTIENINSRGLNPYTFFGPFSRAYLKAAAPDHKLGANVGYQSEKLSANIYLTKFSQVVIQDFQWVDTPATNAAEADALRAVATDLYKSAYTLDFNISYAFTDSFTFTLGANNIFNKYPTPQFDGWTDQGGMNDSVQMGSDGAYYFGRMTFRLN